MNKITVTLPLIPPMERLQPLLDDIWQRKWLTNNGYYHKKLEEELCSYLGVDHISLFANGTIALMVAIHVLELEGEVITTPYSSIATTHALWWNKIKPIFVDIDPMTCNINPDKIEEAITENTTAILPVHVYGTPCDNDKIQSIADKYNLKLVYDAAHAFGVKKNMKTILTWGDISVLSFHATKTYSTVEGGAIICKDKETKDKLDHIKSLGFSDETSIVGVGINGKMNEMEAAYGLANLDIVGAAIKSKKQIVEYYNRELKNINGINLLELPINVDSNYSYFPIFVDKEIYGTSRDELYEKLKANNIYGRRYFYPLISAFEPYSKQISARKQNLSIANRIAEEVICLPLHHELNKEDVDRIIGIIRY